MAKTVRLAAAAFLLSAAALAQTTPPSKGLVYIYIPRNRKAPEANQQPARVYADDKRLVAQLRHGQWTVLEADPGELKLYEATSITMTARQASGGVETRDTMAWTLPLTLRIAPGKTYYVEAGEPWGVDPGTPRSRREAKAKKGMEGCEEVHPPF